LAGAVETPRRLRPLGVGELLDAAIKVCTAHAGPLLKAVLVVILPVQVVTAVVLASTVTDPDYLNITTTDPGTDDTAAFWAGQLVIVLLGMVSYLLATGACFRAIAEGWLGREPSWRESVKFAARRAHSLLWISILYGLSVAVGFVLCLAPGIWLAVAFSVAFPVLFVEDLRGGKALSRSFNLVKGRWWPACGVLLVGFVLASIVASIFTYGVGALALVNDSLAFLILLSTLGSLVTALLTTPFQAAIVTVLYFDLRVRKEGFDLQLLADRLAGGSPLPRQEGAAPYAAPAGTHDWGTPHPAAPYWPPPPGWTPLDAAPPAPTGWQPPGESPAAPSPSTAPSGWQPPGESTAAAGGPPAESPAGSSPPAEAATDDGTKPTEDPFGRSSDEGSAHDAFGRPVEDDGPEEEPPRWLPPQPGDR
jgi:hypothetical protein